jgi:hypothetical protein
LWPIAGERRHDFRHVAESDYRQAIVGTGRLDKVLRGLANQLALA